VAHGGLCSQRGCFSPGCYDDGAMGFDGRTHFNIPRCIFLFRVFPHFRLFVIFLSDDLLHICRTMLLLYPSSLFEHALGSWLEHAIMIVTTPATRSLSFLCFDRIVAFLFNPTCTLLSLRPATVSSCGKPMATIYGNDTVAFRETSRGNFVRNTKKKVNVT
jgi:hypothetical protein